MVERIKKSLYVKLDGCKNKMFPYADLNMKNGDEVTVYAPSKWEYGNKDYAILTNDNKIVHCQSLESVSKWIACMYCN